MSNEELYEKAKETVNDLFSDQSVSVEETRINMNTLVEEIETLISTLPEPIE